MVRENVYPKFGLIKIDYILEEKYDIELLTPKQLQMLYRNCINFMKVFDNMSEKQYGLMSEKEYTIQEHKYFEVNELKDFIDENWCECLI